jgi:hypothetical protein
MKMKFNKLDTHMFWHWFSSHHNEFGENFDNDKTLAELDNRIMGLGDFAWEIGPGAEDNNQLVISPGGNLDLLPITKQIVSCAMNIPGWVFFYAKPPKEWKLIFHFQKGDGEVIEINASKWEYVLLNCEDDGFEIILQTYYLTNLSEEDKLIAAEILLDGILGEEARMLHITYIDIVEEFDFQNLNEVNDITYLKNHFEKLLQFQ